MDFIRNVTNKVNKFFFGFDWGSFQLRTGRYEIYTPLDFDPDKIWLTFESQHHAGCGEQYDAYVSYRIAATEDDDRKGHHHKPKYGFYLFADVKSEKAKITWTAV